MEMITPSDMPSGLWLRARWQLYWAHCRNSGASMLRSSWQLSLMEKHDSSPLIQAAVSWRSKQTHYSSVGLHSSSAATVALVHSESTETTKCAVASQWRDWSSWGIFQLISPWYSHSDGTQVVKCLTLIIRNVFHMYHKEYVSVCIVIDDDCTRENHRLVNALFETFLLLHTVVLISTLKLSLKKHPQANSLFVFKDLNISR